MLTLLLVHSSEAQRINFKTFVQGEGITLTLVDNPLGLNFNQKQNIIVVGDPSVIDIILGDMQVVVVEIDAPIEYDLIAELNWSSGLSLGASDTGTLIPFNMRWAYNNTGEPTDMARRASAIEIPPLFHTLQFPVRRRTAGGPPPPPPTPDHAGYVRPRSKAYLFFYGSLGPIPNNIPAGNYGGTIQLTVNYADNTF
ncbi:MAG: hypothetical protein ACK417_07825 [Bacteroidia bacterium]